MKSGTSGGTITQWISLCQCDVVVPDANDLSASDRGEFAKCETCGKRVEVERLGSLTQWIFRQNSCRCSLPQVKTLQLSPLSKSQPQVPDEMSDDSEEQSKESHAPAKTDNTNRVLAICVLCSILLLILATTLSLVYIDAPGTSEAKKSRKKIRRKSAETLPISTDLMGAYYSKSKDTTIQPPDTSGTIGVEVSGFTLRKVKPFMSAEAAGLKAGDRIEKVDGIDTSKLSGSDLAKRLEGAPGTKLDMVLARGTQKYSVRLVRSDDIYSFAPTTSDAKELYDLGVRLKFRGNIGASKLALTRAASLGKGSIKMLAERELRTELPLNYIPYDAQIMNNRAYNYLVMGDFETASSVLEKCISLCPQFEFPYLNMAICLYISGDNNKAEQYVDKALAVNTNYLNSWIAKSIISEKQNKLDEAMKCMQQAERLNPDAPKKRVALSDMVEKQKSLFSHTLSK